MYCQMNHQKAFTDFDMGFGGSSIWYSVYQGAKLFFLIPPSKQNLDVYKKWSMNEQKGSALFLDMLDSIDECSVVKLQAGDTLLIPGGWIHAHYTIVDSLVFGGHFLHAFNTKMQFTTRKLEREIGIPDEYTFPYFENLLSFVFKRIVSSVSNRKKRNQCVRDIGSLHGFNFGTVTSNTNTHD